MSMNALSIALQGLYPLTPIAMAVQGFIDSLVEAYKWDTAQGVAGKATPVDHDMQGYINRMIQEAQAELARQQADEEAIIMSVVQFVLEEA